MSPASQAQPVSGKSFSLQCVGSQNPASITWLKDEGPMPASERVHFSPGNVTMTFSPVLQADDGLYQCVVTEGQTPIQSIGYKMQVNCEYSMVIPATSLCSEANVLEKWTWDKPRTDCATFFMYLFHFRYLSGFGSGFVEAAGAELNDMY